MRVSSGYAYGSLLPKTGGSAWFVGRRLLGPLMIEFKGDRITDICDKLNKREFANFRFCHYFNGFLDIFCSYSSLNDL